MNTQIAKINMLKNQLRANAVLDDSLLDVVASISREQFVPPAYHSFAYADWNIPLDHGQSMLRPREEGIILQALQLTSSSTVLEIGTGSGYFTSLLAKICRAVTTIDVFADFTEIAQQKLNELGINNVNYLTGNALEQTTLSNLSHNVAYSAIIFHGSLPIKFNISRTVNFPLLVPDILRSKLAIGGRLFAVMGPSPAMQAVIMTRINKHEWEQRVLFETEIAPLIQASSSASFQF